MRLQGSPAGPTPTGSGQTRVGIRSARVDPWTFHSSSVIRSDSQRLYFSAPAASEMSSSQSRADPSRSRSRFGPSITDTVEALTHLKGFTSSTVDDLTIDGHPAKAFSISATSPACRSDTIHPMWDGGYTRGGGSDRIWLGEVDGQPLLIHVLLQRADPRPDIGAIIGSIAIGNR